MENVSDSELVRAVQSGDIRSFEVLVRRYQRQLLSFALRFVKSQAAADDCVQEALFSLYQTIDRVDPSKSFKNYVYAIVKNEALSYLRKTNRFVPLESIEQLDDGAGDSSELLERKERSQAVMQAINELPSAYQRILRLYYFDELSYNDISAQLSMPLNTVRTQLRRAKRLLQQRGIR